MRFVSSPPRMTVDEMDESIARDKVDRFSELEKEIDEMTGKLVETENQLEQKLAEITRLTKEVCTFG